MTQCPVCDAANAPQSRFCAVCGAALDTKTSPAASAKPAADAATPPAAAPPLPASTNGVTTAGGQTQPLQPDMADAARHGAVLEPGTEIAGYRVIEQRDEQPDVRVYRAQAPADLCLQCGTRADEPGARFCEVCGAELLPRDVLLQQPTGDAPKHGPWLALALPPAPQQSMLPPVTTLPHNGASLLVVEETIPGWQSLAELLTSYGAAPDQPAALEDPDAFVVARQLADLLLYLHTNNVALGQLSVAHLLLGPNGRLRLRDVNDLQPLTPDAQASDLQHLQQTLDEITRQPRPTQRLDAPAPSDAPRSLQDVLALARAGRLADAQAWVQALGAVEQAQRAVEPLHARMAARTDVGQIRELNEDAFLTLQLDAALAGRPLNVALYVVADGMGGHDAGEVASGVAIQRMAHEAAPGLLELLADSTTGITTEQIRDVAARAAQAANEAVVGEGRQRASDMGTTLTFALVVGDRCVVGNVGDSRTYLLRNGSLQRVTKDHSLVQRLVDIGQITPDEVYTHPHRNAILRSLGEGPQVDVDLFDLRLQPGDALLLCSDGLWEMVRDDRLGVIAAGPDGQAAVEQAIDEANRNGGEDNITAMVVQFGAQPTAAAASAQPQTATEGETDG